MSISSDEVAMFRITGSRNTATMSIAAAEGAGSLAGFCLFIAGSRNTASLTTAIPVEQAFIDARGNRNRVDVTVPEEMSIAGVAIDARGKQNNVKVEGEGRYSCSETARGNNNSITCGE